MSKSLLSQLQEVANKALTSENIEEGMKYLATAFQLFSKETSKFIPGHGPVSSKKGLIYGMNTYNKEALGDAANSLGKAGGVTALANAIDNNINSIVDDIHLVAMRKYSIP